MKKILVTGANGQLGNQLRLLAVKYPTYKFEFTDVQELDITDHKAVNEKFNKERYDAAVNCAAFTAVDKCEDETALALKLNATAPGYLARAAKGTDTHFIQISTDFVFDGQSTLPYTETDIPNPVSKYGETKLKGEEAVISSGVEYTILRTAWLYSVFGNNFVKSMMKYARERGELRVVYDQAGTPTWAADLAEIIMKIIENRLTGLYHFSNEGVTSWYDFAVNIVKLSGIDCEVFPIRTEEFPLPAKRPAFSVLDKKLIKQKMEIRIPHWQESLEKCIKLMQN